MEGDKKTLKVLSVACVYICVCSSLALMTQQVNIHIFVLHPY